MSRSRKKIQGEGGGPDNNFFFFFFLSIKVFHRGPYDPSLRRGIASRRGSVHRGSYMCAHVLLYLLNELRKRDKCEACQAFYFFLPSKFNKFNMLDSIYHMILQLLKNHIFIMKT